MIVTSLLEYLSQCPVISEMHQILVDFQGDNIDDISLEPTPSETIVQRYVDGSSDRQFQFSLSMRFDYSEELEITINNAELFESLQDWLEEQSENDILPVLEGNKKATGIEALSSGYLYEVDPTLRKARYQIQCALYYTQKAWR